MPKDSYEIHPVDLKEADNFEVLILTLPENEINDKLTYLTREKGKISSSFYEDFVIANCVANINQLLSYINQNLGNQPDLLKIRAELMEAILEHNSQLAPENLIINKNYVVKIKKFKKLKDGEKSIVENSSWDMSYYEDVNNNKTLSNITKDKEKDIKNLKNKAKDKIKDIDELECDIKQVWWKRIGQYVEIKKFNKNDAIHILKKRYFHSPTSFNTFIVSVCVIGFEDLFMLLDNMGIPSRVAPPILMNELYELCRSLNKFLTYNNAQEVSDDPKNVSNSDKDTKPNKATTAGLMHKYGNAKTKTKFKDVPKEDLLKLGDNMKISLIGQDPAIDTLVDTIQRAKIGLKDPVKPIGSFLFAGRTGVGKCVKEGTLIFSEHGIKPIDSFCAGKKIEKLEVGICGINGNTKTSHIYKEGVKPGRNIITDSGYELSGSLIHPVVVINEDGDVVFKKFHELTTDDYVAIQYNQNYFSKTNKKLIFNFEKKIHDSHTVVYDLPTKMNEDLAYYIGLLTGDGGLTKDKTIVFTNKDKQLVKSFYDLSYSLFGVEAKLTSDKYGYAVYSRYIYEFLKHGCNINMVKSIYKEIPSTILESTKECVVAFIQGLMDTDGYFEETPGRVGITLATKKLINQLQTVLLNFGIISSVRHRLVKYNGGFNDAWVLTISSKFAKKFFTEINFRLNSKKDKYNLIYMKKYNPNKDIIPNIHTVITELAHSYRLNRKFYRDYSGYCKGHRRPSRKKLNKLLNDIVNIVGSDVKQNDIFIYLNKLVNTDVFWSKLSKIEEVPGMSLYDFTVPETHTFISNGFISHNTLATKVLADELIKSRDNLITIDCSEYSADHEYSKLIGSPAGYIGFEQGGNLTNAINKNPFSVIVFDEVEKASNKVHELMLQILEEGRLTDGQGQTSSFKDAIIVMTSNVGATEIDSIGKTIGFGDVGKITDSKKDVALTEALKKKFKPEFLNRIDSIVNFKTLIKKDYMRIIDIELYKLETNLKNNDTDYKDLILEFDKTVKNFVYKHGIDEKYGARPLKRCIEREIATPLSRKILHEDIVGDSVILISVKRGKIMFEVSERIEEAPFYMSEGYQVMNGV